MSISNKYKQIGNDMCLWGESRYNHLKVVRLKVIPQEVLQQSAHILQVEFTPLKHRKLVTLKQFKPVILKPLSVKTDKRITMNAQFQDFLFLLFESTWQWTNK